MTAKRSQRASVVMPSELINVEHPFYNSPSVHLAMLKDDVRVIAFKAALEKLITFNKTILYPVFLSVLLIMKMMSTHPCDRKSFNSSRRECACLKRYNTVTANAAIIPLRKGSVTSTLSCG